MADIRLEINGPTRLHGAVSISGAKNAALPEMAATLLTPSPCQLGNVPMVEDTRIMLQTIARLGGVGRLEKNQLRIQNTRLTTFEVDRELARKTRASLLILGPLLARSGRVTLSLPGGCPIGERKVNYHLDGLSRMGARISQRDGRITAAADRLKSTRYHFPSVSVTGTENLVMAAVLARGTTVLENCAREPEVDDLIDLLNRSGARITRNGSDIAITGVKALCGFTHRVIPDRIEAGTYMIAGALPPNEITVRDCDASHNRRLLDILTAVGCTISRGKDWVRITSSPAPAAVTIATRPYPGFPTDLQAQMTTLLTQADGSSTLTENIFENRFQHSSELNKMGARIRQSGPGDLLIKGPTPLRGATLKSTDLRASAALVLAGIIAEGKTTILNAMQLFRGYERMPQKLNRLGASIKSIKE